MRSEREIRDRIELLEADSYDSEAHQLEWVLEDSQAPEYKVGDPDPTPGQTQCLAQSKTGKWVCSWVRGHPGEHVAANGVKVLEVWS